MNIAAKSQKAKPSNAKIWDGRGNQLASARHSMIPGHAVDNLDLTCIHFRLVCHIGRQNPERGWLRLSQMELAECWGYKRGSINRAIGQLVEWGLVERLPQPETGESFCLYRIKMGRIEEGVPRADDTQPSEECHLADDRGVKQEVTGVSRYRTPRNGASLYSSTDHSEVADEERESAKALPSSQPHADIVDAEFEELSHPKDSKPSKPARTAKLFPAKSGRRGNARGQLVEGWRPSDSGIEFARVRGLTTEQIRDALEKFSNYHQAKRSVMADWDPAWRNWVIDEVKFSKASPRISGPRTRADLTQFL